MRPGQLLLQVMGEPWLRCMLLTLRAMTMATGMLDTVVSFTAWALREAVAVMAALAIADSAEGLAVHGGEVGGAFQICWRNASPTHGRARLRCATCGWRWRRIGNSKPFLHRPLESAPQRHRH